MSIKLSELKIGQSATVLTVGGEGSLRQHFLDMGVIPGAELTLVKYAPMGDPMQLRIHGYELTLRLDDAAQILVQPVEEKKQKTVPRVKATVHPGLGEDGIFHPKGSGNPLPEDEVLTFALVGNQNSGKTTLFNQLTGSNQHVGNFPGVTVDRKDGVIKGYPKTKLTDLPGIYSMSPYSEEEIVSRNFVLNEKPRAIINIVDATNIERNLYLTMQLLEMDTPMVVALNIMDELTANGGSVEINTLESMLGVPVVPISAAKNQGVDELVRHAVHIAHYQEKPGRQDFCSAKDRHGAVHRCIHAVSHLIESKAPEVGLPVRFAATKLIEGDALIQKQLALTESEQNAEHGSARPHGICVDPLRPVVQDGNDIAADACSQVQNQIFDVTEVSLYGISHQDLHEHVAADMIEPRVEEDRCQKPVVLFLVQNQVCAAAPRLIQPVPREQAQREDRNLQGRKRDIHTAVAVFMQFLYK